MMKYCAMTFRRAIVLSITVHVALFGGALAFAHYGGPFFSSGLDVITVSLVGPERGGRLVRKTARRSEPAMPPQEPAVVEDRAVLQGEPPSAAAPAGDGLPDAPEAAQEGTRGTPGKGSAPFGYSPAEWDLLQTVLEKAKTYPRFARERGIEGTVLVRFKVQPTGAIERVDIVRSSGTKILDDASVKTIYRAAPVPYVEGWVEVPMVYQLIRPEEE
jgi:TonB family protein